MGSLQALSRKLHSMFSKIGAENNFLIKMFKLKVAAINLVYVVCGSNKSALGQTEAFIKDVEEVTKDMTEAEITAEPFLVGVLTSLNIPEAKPGYIARKLKPLLVSHPLVGISIDAELYNVVDTSALRICIFTGDQQSYLSIPRMGDLTPRPEGGLRLLTTALLSHQVWSEPLDVEISLVLDLGEDKRDNNENKPLNIVSIVQKPVKVQVLPKPVRRGI